MKVTGEATLKSSPQELWDAFNDPAVLVHTIPGCQRLEQSGEDAYTMTVSAGVAAIKGVYEGSVKLTDKVEPSSLKMTASGSGGPGTIEVDVRVSVSERDGGSLLSYDADAVVGGMIGGVSQRMLASVGKRIAGEFFANLDAHIERGGPAETAAPAPADAAGETDEAASAAPGVFERRPAAGAAAPGSSDDFVKGALVGAALLLVGVVVGGVLGRRSR